MVFHCLYILFCFSLGSINLGGERTGGKGGMRRKGDRFIFPTLNLTGRVKLEYRK